MTTDDRRFGLADLIFLVAAFSIAFAVCTFVQRQWDGVGANWTTVNTITVGWSFAGYTLLTLTAYLGAMILRRKPSRQAIIASRGRASVLAICAMALVTIPTNWNTFFHSALPLYSLIVFLPFSIAGDPLTAACAGICTWAALNLASVSTSRADWLDHAGKVATCIWLLFAFAQPLLDLAVLRALGVPMW